MIAYIPEPFIGVVVEQHKQRHPRIRKRVSIRFGTTSELRSLGFTTNASFRGLGVAATNIFPAGTPLHFELKLTGDRFCHGTGMVAWSMRGIAALQVPGTMGVRIQSADESFFQLLAENTPDEPAKPTAAKAAPAPSARTSPMRATTPVAQTRAVVPGATMSGRPSNPKPSARVAEPPPPKMPFRFPRLDERMDVQFGTLGAAPATTARIVGRPAPLTANGFTTNVSRTGFAICCSTPLKPGEEVRFQMKLPDEKACEGRGSVVWTKLATIEGVERPQMGIQIARVDQTYKDYLQWRGRRVGIAV